MEDIKTQTGGHYTTEHEHEASDVNVRGIVGFGVFLAISGILVNVVLYGMYVLLVKYGDRRDPDPNPMVQEQIAKHPPKYLSMPEATPYEMQQREMTRIEETFPSPRLQVNEYGELDMYRKAQAEQLDEYRWINKDAGTVRIPIERAMELIAERGLPKAGSAATAAAPKAPPLAKRLAAKPSGK